jgi:hypothetical protein
MPTASSQDNPRASLSCFKGSGKPPGSLVVARQGRDVGEPTLNWRGRGNSEHKRYDRRCGVNMHQLSNLTHWFRLRAIWRIGVKPLQRVDECAVRYHDQGGLQRKI